MAQVKKPAVRDAILKSAFHLFSRRGYQGTTLSQIAAGAGVSDPRRPAPGRCEALGSASFAHILMMAFDGFVINYHLRPGKHCSRETIEVMCQLLLGVAPGPARRCQRT